MKHVFRLAMIWFSFSSSQGLAKVVYYDEGSETIPIIRDSNVIFRFPAEVKTISQASRFKIEPSDAEAPDFTTLTVSPRFSTGDTKVTFLLASGEVVNLRLVVVSKAIPNRTDTFFEFKPSDAQIEPSREGAKTDELTLMKSMIRFEDVNGFTVKNVKRDFGKNRDGKLHYKLDWLYLGPKLIGNIFTVTNTSHEVKIVDLTKLVWGKPSRALLSQVDKPFLAPYESTVLRVVSRPSSYSQNSNLPISKIDKETLQK